MTQKQTLICFETEEQLINPRYPSEPRLQKGGPDSGLPPPYLVATGQSGHAVVGLDIGSVRSRMAVFESDVFRQIAGNGVLSQAGRLSNGNLTIGIPPTGDTVGTIGHFRKLIGSDWYVEAECGFFSAEMFTELLIRKMLELGNSTLGRPISKAVVTTPTTFTSNQRKLLKAAAEAAGVDVLQLINEPTAAAFYHCYQEFKRDTNATILVYHLGAGTFAVSVVEFQHGLVEVKASLGDNSLSAEALIATFVKWMIDTFEADSGHKLNRTSETLIRLFNAAEVAINDLHTAGRAHVKVTNLEVAASGPNLKSKTYGYLMASMTLNEYHQLIQPTIEKTFDAVDRVLAESNTPADSIEQVLMVGDHRSLTPFLRNFYQRLPGATVFPATSDTYPVYGAALQAALLNNSIRDYVVWDVINEPIWIEQNGEFKQVISRGTPLPVTAYHKCESPDSTVNLHVVQGPEQGPKYTLADITVSNCPPTTAGETKVEVHIIANADGVIDYRAKHIGLDSMLPVNVIDGPLTPVLAHNDARSARQFEESRLNRLARIMNTTPLTVLNVLRSRGYSIEAIKNGVAIEDMLRKLKLARLKKNAG